MAAPVEKKNKKQDQNGESNTLHGRHEEYLNQVNKQIYSRSIELAQRNKTLSLLSKLYEITLANVHVEELGVKLTYAIRSSLNLELVSVLKYSEKEKMLTPISYALSEPTAKLIRKSGLIKTTIPMNASGLCTKAVKTGKRQEDDSSKLLWGLQEYIKDSEQLAKKSHIRYVLVYPLIVNDAVLGILVVGLNRIYPELTDFEQESLQNIVNVVTIAVNNALIYQELEEANKKLKELDQAKSEFMSIASHQLRTPLAGIMGYLSMISDGDYGTVSKEQMPIIHDVLEATKRLIRMVNIFLNVTRIEAGRFVMNYTTVPFHEVLEGVYKELKPTADLKKVMLTYNKKTLPEVEVDADKIKDVVLNLVDNAIKYSPQGSVTLDAEAKPKVIHFWVTDTGVGIANGEAENLFNKFVRGSGIARVEPNGSGLGLFIAKKIAEGHGGRIWAESAGENKGSTFNVEIPIKADPKAKKAAEEFKNRAIKGSGTKEPKEKKS